MCFWGEFLTCFSCFLFPHRCGHLLFFDSSFFFSSFFIFNFRFHFCTDDTCVNTKNGTNDGTNADCQPTVGRVRFPHIESVPSFLPPMRRQREYLEVVPMSHKTNVVRNRLVKTLFIRYLKMWFPKGIISLMRRNSPLRCVTAKIPRTVLFLIIA